MPSKELTVGSLFSGIGGLELGLERAGMRTVWQVEKDDYCRRVLAKHWPEAQRFDDVCSVGSHNLLPVDVICGGFPCQDISYAGKGAGLDGARSGLWFEYARIIRELGPRYVVVENVRALATRGLDAVLGTLADLGYDAEWSLLSACALGAPHTRDRLFIVAHANGVDGQTWLGFGTIRPGPLPQISDRARAWRDRIDGSLAASRADDRETHGAARRMVTAGGNAVVPACGEYIGRLIVADHSQQRVAA